MSRIKRFFHRTYKTDKDILREIRRKKGKHLSRLERIVLKYYIMYTMVSIILKSESKREITAEQAISKLREYLYKNQ